MGPQPVVVAGGAHLPAPQRECWAGPGLAGLGTPAPAKETSAGDPRSPGAGTQLRGAQGPDRTAASCVEAVRPHAVAALPPPQPGGRGQCLPPLTPPPVPSAPETSRCWEVPPSCLLQSRGAWWRCVPATRLPGSGVWGFRVLTMASGHCPDGLELRGGQRPGLVQPTRPSRLNPMLALPGFSGRDCSACPVHSPHPPSSGRGHAGKVLLGEAGGRRP